MNEILARIPLADKINKIIVIHIHINGLVIRFQLTINKIHMTANKACAKSSATGRTSASVCITDLNSNSNSVSVTDRQDPKGPLLAYVQHAGCMIPR